MSLKVWLPLTKDLRNQGLSNVTVTNNGATFNSAGKLGGCYTFGSGKWIVATPSSSIMQAKAVSIACWVKITSWNSSYDCLMSWADGTGWINSRVNLARNNTNSTLRFTIADGSNYAGVNCTTALALNTWYHVVGTYDGSNIKIYINGNLEGTAASTISIAYAGNFNIGGWSGNNYPINGSLNDIRLYNHCLSPMEVKQLSQGLILHYLLNRQGWGQENLVWNSNWNVHSTTPPESWVNWGSPPTREIVTIDGKNWLHVISNTTQFQGYSQNWTKRNGVGELTANTKMTVSFTAKLATAASIAPIGIHWCNSSGTIVSQNWTTTALTTSPKRYSFTYTTPSDCVAFNIMVGDNTNTAHEVWVTDIKLEFGEIATPWCPNSSDTLATTMGLNSTTEYDCSGFGNNGTRTGTFSWTSDTPKYSVSTHIGATNQKIHISNFPTSGFGNSYSFAWWGKRTSNNPMFWGFSDGIRLNGMYVGTLWNTGDGSNNPLYKIGTTTQVTAPSVNVWHHYVMTGNGTKCYVYLDGELWAEAKTYKAISGTSIYINGWNSATDYCSDNTDISDFRIYATALSADDVKSLYQNSAYIDSSGNVYGAVHSEV